MTKAKRPRGPRQWTALLRVTTHAVVTVEAKSEEAARAKFKAMDWLDTQYDEVIDFDEPGKIEETT